LVQPGSFLLGKCAEIDIFLQLQSASECGIGLEELVGSRSIFTGKRVEIAILPQPESAAECDIGFAKLARPRAETDGLILARRESRAVEFRKHSIR